MRGESRAKTVTRDVVTALLVYVVALGAIFAVASTAVLGGHRHARADRTRLDIENLETALKLYRARTGQYPDAATGWAALVETQILDKEPRDQWGNPYRYETMDGRRPVITSLGSDGLPGGTGDAADLSNAPLRMAATP